MRAELRGLLTFRDWAENEEIVKEPEKACEVGVKPFGCGVTGSKSVFTACKAFPIFFSRSCS